MSKEHEAAKSDFHALGLEWGEVADKRLDEFSASQIKDIVRWVHANRAFIEMESAFFDYVLGGRGIENARR